MGRKGRSCSASGGSDARRMLVAFLLVLLLPLGGAQNIPTGHIGGLPQPFGVPGGESPLGDVNSRNPEDPEQARRIKMLNVGAAEVAGSGHREACETGQRTGMQSMAKEDAFCPPRRPRFVRLRTLKSWLVM